MYIPESGASALTGTIFSSWCRYRRSDFSAVTLFTYRYMTANAQGGDEGSELRTCLYFI